VAPSVVVAYNGGVLRFPRSLIVALIVTGVATTAAQAADEPLPLDGPSLYDRLAHASTVVLGRVEGVARRAELRIEEVLRGHPQPTIEIAYRADNYLRQPGTRPATFEEGELTLLLLEKVVDKKRKPIPGRYRLVGGPAGKLVLPLEGRDAFLGVVRRFLTIQDLDHQTERWEEMRSLLDERDLRLVHVGLAKIVSFRLADDELLPVLLRYLQHPAPALRSNAIDALEQLVSPRGRGQASPSSPRIVSHLAATARGDEHPDVRAAAVRALGRLRRADLQDLFREAALRDPSQIVRYEASVALADLGEAVPPR
jgi:hypothetical protein